MESTGGGGVEAQEALRLVSACMSRNFSSGDRVPARIEQARGQDAQAQQRLIAWLASIIARFTYSYQLSREIQATLAASSCQREPCGCGTLVFEY